MKRFIGGVDTLYARLLYSSEDQIDLPQQNMYKYKIVYQV